jgi:catechol 2,3-dioxygenase-like lactoylglutathione lyase family enzyme
VEQLVSTESAPILRNVIFTVSDMEGAVRFYRDVVGLPLKFQDGDRWAAFDGGGCTVALSSGDAEVPTPSLKAADLEVWLAAAVQAGAERAPIEDGPHERLVRMRDPAGNPFIVYESK